MAFHVRPFFVWPSGRPSGLLACWPAGRPSGRLAVRLAVRLACWPAGRPSGLLAVWIFRAYIARQQEGAALCYIYIA